MSLIIAIIASVGAFILGVYIATLSLKKRIKIIVWILCGLVSIASISNAVLDWKREKKVEGKEEEMEKIDDYYYTKIEKIELSTRGLPLKYIDGLGDHPELQHYLNNAEKYEEEHNYNEAIKKYEICLSHPRATDDNIVAANILIGNCHYRMSQLDEAMRFYQEALKLYKRLKDKKEKLSSKSAALGNIGLIYITEGKLDKALEYLEGALKTHREIGYKKGEAADLGNIGIIYRAKGKLDRALEYYEGALKIDREMGYKKGEAACLGNIGIIYRDKGKLDKALEYNEEALKIDREIGYKQGEADQLGNIGLIYAAKSELDKALEYLEGALKTHREVGYKQGEAACLGSIGVIYKAKGKLDKAQEYLKDALKIFDKNNLIYGRDVFQSAIDSIKKK